MTAWAVHGIELPFGDETVSRWIDPSGAVHDRPVPAADLLPGRFFVPGLVMRMPTRPSGPVRRAWWRWMPAPPGRPWPRGRRRGSPWPAMSDRRGA